MIDARAVTHPDEYFARAIAAARGAPELALVLERLLSSSLTVGPDGVLYDIRARVTTLNGVAIHVFPRDHGPPHFHVVGTTLMQSSRWTQVLSSVAGSRGVTSRLSGGSLQMAGSRS